MSHHEPRPLPDPSELPYGLVRITVWSPSLTVDRQWSGKRYISSHDGWRNSSNRHDILLANEEVDWTFDGYSLDYFNRGYLLSPESETDGLVKLAMWALDRWAVEKGLKEEMDKSRRSAFLQRIEPGQIIEVDL